MMCTPTMYPVKQSHYDNSKAVAINHTGAGPEASTNCIIQVKILSFSKPPLQLSKPKMGDLDN